MPAPQWEGAPPRPTITEDYCCQLLWAAAAGAAARLPLLCSFVQAAAALDRRCAYLDCVLGPFSASGGSCSGRSSELGIGAGQAPHLLLLAPLSHTHNALKLMHRRSAGLPTVLAIEPSAVFYTEGQKAEKGTEKRIGVDAAMRLCECGIEKGTARAATPAARGWQPGRA